MVISFLLVNIYYFAFFFNICNLLKMLMHFGAATVRIIRNPHFEVYASSVEALSEEGEMGRDESGAAKSSWKREECWKRRQIVHI